MPAIISLVWKGLTVKNALAYYETESITDEKSFKVLPPIGGEDGPTTLSTTTFSIMTFSITINKQQH